MKLLNLDPTPPRRRPPIDRIERQAVQATNLVSVTCRSCGADLAAVLPGAECYCRPCGVWTATPKEATP